MKLISLWLLVPVLLLMANDAGPRVELLIRNGIIYDGSGQPGFPGDVGINGDTIVFVGYRQGARGDREIDAAGKAVSPGFINMLSWAASSLIRDGFSQSDIRQGVTLEVFGEGSSLGPLTEDMRRRRMERQQDFKYDIPWTTLGEALEFMETRGVAPNIASFVGATTIRIHEVGYENRSATAAELGRMKDLVRTAMEEGALGVGSSLIYAPADYAPTEELISLAKVAAAHDGLYISHMRSEGDDIMDALEELFTIAREAQIPAEIYHLKSSRRNNWHKLDQVIDKIEVAHREGLKITADMYTYNASSTGLTGMIPTWVQEGGHQAWMDRMRDSVVRSRLEMELRDELVKMPPEGILLVGFRNPDLEEQFMGKTLAEAAEIRGQAPEKAIIDLVLEDDSRIQCVYFSMSEDNIRRKITLPWVSFCSDAGSLDPRWADHRTHPRAYGSFVRLLGKYSREEGLLKLEEAIRRLTSFPAGNLKLNKRGLLAPGYYADVVVFDPETITDHATFEDPHQFSTGVVHVIVNGVPVLQDGEHTGATPGQFIRGPGWIGWNDR